MNRPQDPRLADGWQPLYEPVILESALEPAVCDRAIAKAKEVGFGTSSVYDDSRSSEVLDHGYRNSASAWLEPEHDPDLYRQIQSLITTINTERYRFSIYGMEPIQIIRYETGDFFDEHFDFGPGDPSRRKISLVIQLSDPADYQGGELILGGQITMPAKRGAGCAFPSWLAHRVDKVRSGVRYSLAAWAKGNHFL